MNNSALQETRVLDFTWLLAGPYATRILADFGAEVIKVQSQKTAKGAERNDTGYFNMWNRNKLGITLDMNYSESRDIVLKLVEKSDVVVENFSTRVMSNWGLGYEMLREVKDNLVMVSMSGMGQTGVWRDSAALGPTVQALSGITYLTSFAKESPLGLGYSYADIVSGLYGASVILAALEHRDRTGQGQYIDVSEYEAMCTLLGPAILDCTANHRVVEPRGTGSDYTSSAPYGCYRCEGVDRWCVIAVSTEQEWYALCQVLSYPAWTDDEKFSTPSKRREHIEELNELLGQWTAVRSAEEVMGVLQAAGVPCGVVNNAADLAHDPQLDAREFFIHLPHGILGDTILDGTPIKLSRTPARFQRAAPMLGQDNNYVYRELLCMDEEEIQDYIDRGIIN